MQVAGLESISYEGNTQKINSVSSNKSFQMNENMQKPEKVLGIGFLNAPTGNISYGMRAEYVEDSTSDSPIIKVTIQTGHSEETHFVDINQVDARNATEIEMFALCCYADDTGKGTGGKLGTWQTLNYYRTNAADNGTFQLTNMVNSCSSLRQNWLAMIEQMRQIYIKAGLYKQSMDGNSLLKCLSESDQSTAKNGSVNNIYERMNQNGSNKTFTDIAVYNMNYDTTLFISDDGTLTCIDQERGYHVLWEIPLTKSDEAKMDELIKKKMDFILRDKGIVEEYLKGNITIEDIEKWQASKKDYGLQDSLFSGCSDDIKKAWEKAQKTDVFLGNSIGKDYLLTEMDKYMLMNLSGNEKIKDASLDDIMELTQNMIASLKNSLELYGVSIQTTKLEELDILEKFSEELEKLKS